MNREQSNASQALNDSANKNIYSTGISAAQTVRKEKTLSSQDTDNIFKKSSTKYGRDERMKKFYIEFEFKLRLEQELFERRKLELGMQMKELETKHHIFEEERELERKVETTP